MEHHSKGLERTLNASEFDRLTRLGCIVLSVETFWLTRIGRSHRCSLRFRWARKVVQLQRRSYLRTHSQASSPRSVTSPQLPSPRTLSR
jgi:hypothetical protein